jgi:hypothetical protein
VCIFYKSIWCRCVRYYCFLVKNFAKKIFFRKKVFHEITDKKNYYFPSPIVWYPNSDPSLCVLDRISNEISFRKISWNWSEMNFVISRKKWSISRNFVFRETVMSGKWNETKLNEMVRFNETSENDETKLRFVCSTICRLPTVRCLLTCDVCLPVWCLSTCIISFYFYGVAHLCDVRQPVPWCLLNWILYDGSSSLWCLLNLWFRPICMMSAYILSAQLYESVYLYYFCSTGWWLS